MSMEAHVGTRCYSQHSETNKLFQANAILQQQLQRILPTEGDYSLVAGLRASWRYNLNEVGDTGERPRIGIVVQGSKCVEEAGRQFHCCETAYFVDNSGGCGLSYVTKVPYLSLSLVLNRHLIRRLMIEGRSSIHPGFFSPDEVAAIADSGIVAAFSRLINLVERPEQASFLAPLIIKEIHYRVLIGPLGEKARALASEKANNCFCSNAWDRVLC